MKAKTRKAAPEYQSLSVVVDETARRSLRGAAWAALGTMVAVAIGFLLAGFDQRVSEVERKIEEIAAKLEAHDALLDGLEKRKVNRRIPWR